MAGFLPVGSFPVASVPAGAGVSYTLTTGNITTSGHTYTLSYVFAPIRVTQITAEVFHSGNSSARATMVVAEVFRTLDDAKARMTMITAEVFRRIDVAVARTTQITAEVFYTIPLDGDDTNLCILW